MGDLNLERPGSRRLKYKDPIDNGPPPGPIPQNDGPASHLDRNLAPQPRAPPPSLAWRNILAQITELTQPAPTHYSTSTLTGTVIDRSFTTIPAWALALTRVSSEALRDPQALQLLDISDHTPIKTTHMTAPKPPRRRKKIPKATLLLPEFETNLKRLMTLSNFQELPHPLPKFRNLSTSCELQRQRQVQQRTDCGLQVPFLWRPCTLLRRELYISTTSTWPNLFWDDTQVQIRS